MDAVKSKLYVVRVLLHGIASLLRTARPTIDAVEESFHAVEETSPAVDAFSHGICVLFHGFPLLLPAARHEVDAVEEAFLRHLRPRGVGWAKCWQTGCMLRSRRGDWGVLRAINILLSIFGAICRPFSCKSRIFFSHLQSTAKKVEKFFRGVNRLF